LRKRDEIQETMTQLLAVIQEEIAAIDSETAKERDAIDREFVRDLFVIQGKLIQPAPDAVASGFLAPDPTGPSASDPALAALLERYEEKLRQIQSKRQKNELDQLRKGVAALYDQRLHHLEFDRRSKCQKLEVAYRNVLKRRVLSAATPYIGLHRGPANINPFSGDTTSRLVKNIYRIIFGKLPRVTQLSCYWAPLRHLVRLVDTAAARGAENVLVIGSRHGSIETIADQLPGLHGLVSMLDLKSGNLGKALDRGPYWDLCICNLEFAELIEFSTILSVVRPLMSKGGTIIGFYLNYDAAAIKVDGASIDGISQLSDKPRFYFAGTPASVRAIRKFRAASNSYQRASDSFVKGTMFVFRLLKTIPLTLAANRAEVAIAPVGFSTPPPICTSITVEVVGESIL
jgi:hypothetical protein